MSLQKRVVVTGMGLVTSLGDGVEANWAGLLSGATGIGRHEREGRPEYLKFFGKVNGLDRLNGIPPNLAGQVRFLNRGSVLGFEAARQAVASSKIELSTVPRERRSLFIASGDLTKVGYEFMHPALKDAIRNGGKATDFRILNKSTMDKVNPFFLLESISNNLFSFLVGGIPVYGSEHEPWQPFTLRRPRTGACLPQNSDRAGRCLACRRVRKLGNGNPHVRNGGTWDTVQVQGW